MKEEIKIIKGQTREIAYSNDFKNWVREHPQALSKVLGCINQVLISKEEGTYKVDHAEFDDTSVDLINHGFGDSFKVRVRNDSFFVKRDNFRESGGVKEFESSMKAKDKLKGLFNVEVVEYQLGYTNKKTGEKYYVARWVSGMEKAEKHAFIPDVNPNGNRELSNRIDVIKERLKGFWDVNAGNMFYDPKSKKILVFDLENRSGALEA